MIERIAQVKLPVSDLVRSVAWYQQLLDLRLWVEIVEDGVVRGAGLVDHEGRFNIALRDRTVCASQPDLRGFDVVAFAPSVTTGLEELGARCDRLGIPRGGIETMGPGRRMDVADPDGTVLRFYELVASTEGFVGVEFADGQEVGRYQTPRLREGRSGPRHRG